MPPGPDETSLQESREEGSNEIGGKRRRKPLSRITLGLRRIHLYVGLFLLPWVFLYGITGAMYNHYGLFSDASIVSVDAEQLADSTLVDFPTNTELAQQVVDALQLAHPDVEIVLDQRKPPEFANDMIVQLFEADLRHAVHIDPVARSAWVATSAKEIEPLEPLLTDVRNLKLAPNPYELARQAVPQILSEVGIETRDRPRPMGWSKLNFLATVDGVAARVTYVLRDGHVDVTKYNGQDGMSPRAFFLRLHTSHGQPPHWNGRMFWSLIVDVMAVAMVTWGVTGLVMWWQIKRTRIVGGIVILMSLTTAVALYMSMLHFYATTKL